MGIMSTHNKRSIRSLYSTVITLLFLFSFMHVHSQDFEEVVDLSGQWKFSIGDNPEWSQPGYDDSYWENIRVPKKWEEQGFHGYDGYAWYRTTVKLPSELIHATYFLKLGYIDDVDEVYINGIKIGQTGSFPPDYSTAYNANRIYTIPHKIKHIDGKFTIAVRVYDEGGEGGFVHGDVSIVIDRSSIYTDLDLQGEWKFKTGDCSGIPEELDYENWDEIIVPGTWEDQGYKHYDGVACYVNEFELEGQFEGERMVLILGRIDDLDMVYLNGVLIGQSGEFKKETVQQRSDTYKQIRGYYIPLDILVDNGKNVLVVKVLDTYNVGGIWDGSVGLITQDNYIRYWRNRRNAVR